METISRMASGLGPDDHLERRCTTLLRVAQEPIELRRPLCQRGRAHRDERRRNQGERAERQSHGQPRMSKGKATAAGLERRAVSCRWSVSYRKVPRMTESTAPRAVLRSGTCEKRFRRRNRRKALRKLFTCSVVPIRTRGCNDRTCARRPRFAAGSASRPAATSHPPSAQSNTRRASSGPGLRPVPAARARR